MKKKDLLDLIRKRRVNLMTKKTYTGKGGQTWEWEETPETIQALKKLHESSKRVQEFRYNKPKRAS